LEDDWVGAAAAGFGFLSVTTIRSLLTYILVGWQQKLPNNFK